MAHNTTSHGGAMRDYLEAVKTSGDIETVFPNKQGTGIGVTLKKH